MTFGPRKRISRLSPIGTILTSTPGAGRPISPATTSVPTAKVQLGAVSVMPRPVMTRMRSPTVASACASSLSQTACDRPAPANMKAFTRR